MSNDLTPQQVLPAPVAPAGTPALELEQIQGDVLLGLQKNVERFLFFQIADVAAFKSALRHKIIGRITTTREVKAREFELRDLKNQGHKTPIPNTGLNVAFTNDGLQKLAPGTDLGDDAFTKGAKERAALLGDPTAGGNLSTWLPEFLAGTIDGVFLITGGTQAAVDAEEGKVQGILGAAINVVRNDLGTVRPGPERGHEHFGWQDGISQPGVNGLTSPFPGQQMMDPGAFVFGYPAPPGGPAQQAPPAWAKNGSFMVFRRLKQLVPEFTKFVLDQGISLGVDPVLLGARLVGRWKSGAPMALTPNQDDLQVGTNAQQNNNFDFADDQEQRRCPFGAHIRKTNPRTDLAIAVGKPATAPSDVLQAEVSPRRIIRQGIPFGPEVTVDEATNSTTTEERGLMFVCYQTSIVNQFEFLQISWADNPGFIFNRKHPDGSDVTTGLDPIIGQNTPGNARVGMDEPFPNYPIGNRRSTLTEPQSFVVPTGGAYFFVPPISALLEELST